MQYNSVDFGNRPLKKVIVRALSEAGGTLQIHTKGINGPVIAEVNIPKSMGWKDIKAPVAKFQQKIQDLFVISTDDRHIEVDWISFE